MAQALVRACEGVAAAASFLDIYIQAAVIRRDTSSLLGSWLSQDYQVQSQPQPLQGLHAGHTFCDGVAVLLASASQAGLLLVVQAARETYARAGYAKWMPKTSRMVPWANDVDTSAELMYKQLHLDLLS